jgi:Sortase domain
MPAATRKRLLSLGIGALVFTLWQIDFPALGKLEARVLPAVLAQAGGSGRAADCPRTPRGSDCVVAQISVPGERPTRIVLRAADDRVPTEGWGYFAGAPLPGAGDATVFRIHARAGDPALERLRRGDTLVVELPDARQFVYRVTGAHVAERHAIRLDDDARGASALTLLTRHPDKSGGDLWVVINATLLPEPLLAFTLRVPGDSVL